MRLLLLLVTPFVIGLVRSLPLKQRSDERPSAGSILARLRHPVAFVKAFAQRRLENPSGRPTIAPHWDEVRELTGAIEDLLTDKDFAKNLNLATFIMQQQQSPLTTTTTTTIATTDSNIAALQSR